MRILATLLQHGAERKQCTEWAFPGFPLGNLLLPSRRLRTSETQHCGTAQVPELSKQQDTHLGSLPLALLTSFNIFNRAFPLSIDYWIQTFTAALCSFEAKELPKLPSIHSKLRGKNPMASCPSLPAIRTRACLFWLSTNHTRLSSSLAPHIRPSPFTSVPLLGSSCGRINCSLFRIPTALHRCASHRACVALSIKAPFTALSTGLDLKGSHSASFGITFSLASPWAVLQRSPRAVWK